MKERHLLIFRWGLVEYGIPVENVKGMIHDNWLETVTDVEPMPILTGYEENESTDFKQAILVESNGVSFTLIVDSISPDTRIIREGEMGDEAIEAPITIWKFKPGRKSYN